VNGWWRRNRWGLIALIPALALAFGLELQGVYRDYWKSEPRQPISPDAQGWITYAEGHVRLAAFGPGDDLRAYGNEPFTPPPGVKIWKATLSFEAAKDSAIGACTMYLEDSNGRLYGTNPSELSGSRVDRATCTPGSDPATLAYTNVIYFATPVSARVVALRIEVSSQLPRYARFSASS
jgi:hypothetical protein